MKEEFKNVIFENCELIKNDPGRTHELNKKYFVIHGSKC